MTRYAGLALMFGTAVVSQDLVNFQRGATGGCVKIPAFKEFCVHYEATSCSTLELHVNATYGGEPILDERFTKEDQKYCQSLGEKCQECLTLDSATIKPNYIKICPKATVQCVLGPMFPETDLVGPELPCLELGNPCEASSCGDCAKQEGCGWCGVSQECHSEFNDAPFCGECAAQWQLEYDTCPEVVVEKAREEKATAEAAAAEAAANPAVIAILIVVLLMGLTGAAFCLVKRRGKKRRGTDALRAAGLGAYSQPMDILEDDDGAGMPVDTSDVNIHGNIPVAVAVTTPDEDAPEPFCAKCGARRKDLGSAFCSKCGGVFNNSLPVNM